MLLLLLRRQVDRQAVFDRLGIVVGGHQFYRVDEDCCLMRGWWWWGARCPGVDGVSLFARVLSLYLGLVQHRGVKGQRRPSSFGHVVVVLIPDRAGQVLGRPRVLDNFRSCLGSEAVFQ